MFVKIKELTKENQDLKDEICHLKGKDTKLAYASTDAQSFYQEVFITDLMNDINIEAIHYKQKLAEQNLIIEKLQKEVDHYKKTVERYRKTVTELSQFKKDHSLIANVKHPGRTKSNFIRSHFGQHETVSQTSSQSSLGGMDGSVRNIKKLVLKSKFVKHNTMLFGDDKPSKSKFEVKIDMINN